MSVESKLAKREVRVTQGYYLPVSLVLQVEEVAKRRKVPMSRIVEEALRFYLSFLEHLESTSEVEVEEEEVVSGG